MSEALDLGENWVVIGDGFYEYTHPVTKAAVGFVELHDQHDYLYLGMINVYREHQGQGFGTMMLHDVCDIDRRPIHLVVDPSREGISAPRLKAWYRRHGFQEYPKPTRYSRGAQMRLPEKDW